MRTLKKLIFKTFRCVSGLLLELHFLTLSSFQRTTYCCNQSCVFLRRLDLSKLNKVSTNVWVSVSFLRKEVIQPHLPIRLPCYDFTPIICPTLGGWLPKGLPHRLRVLQTLVVWRAVCKRPGNVFTVACWSTITSDSGFMQASCSLQSELRMALRD